MEASDALRNVGLSNAEVKVYLALLKLGRSRSGRIIKSTGLQSSVVHNSLGTLSEKGFIAYVRIGSIKEYSALDPATIESYIEAKRTEFRAVLPQLKSMRLQQEFDSAEVYEGYAGILNAMLSMVKGAKRGEVYKYFGAPTELLTEESIKFFAKADIVRKERGIVLRGIATEGNKRLESYSYSEIRFTKQQIPPAMNIFKDKVLIISFSQKPTAILIRSREIAQQYHHLWDAIWAVSRRK